MKNLWISLVLTVATSRTFLYVWTWLNPYPNPRRVIEAMERNCESLVRAATGTGPSAPAPPVQ